MTYLLTALYVSTPSLPDQPEAPRKLADDLESSRRNRRPLPRAGADIAVRLVEGIPEGQTSSLVSLGGLRGSSLRRAADWQQDGAGDAPSSVASACERVGRS